MQLLHRALYIGSLLLCLGPSLEAAEPLLQPASVLPWQSAQVQAKPDVVPAQESDTPAWLLDSAKPLPKFSTSQQTLPMVETDHYVEIGQLGAGSKAAQPSASRAETAHHPRTQRWLDIFRSAFRN